MVSPTSSPLSYSLSLRKHRLKRSPRGFEAAPHHHDVHSEAEHPAAGVVGSVRELWIDRDRAPVLLVLLASGGDALDGVPELVAFPLGEDAEHLGEVARSDEQQIDAVDGG